MKPEAIFAGSEWIWPESHFWDLANSFALFRKTFALRRVPRSAPLFITADQSYRLYVNGHWVGRGPARGFQASWPFDEVELAPWLRRGRNVIAVRAYHPGLSNFQYCSVGFAGLLIAGRWPGTELRSDATWKSVRQPGVEAGTVPSSVQLFAQEHVDLTVGPVGWEQRKFDDRAWKQPQTRPWNSPPWSRLEPRGIPALQEALLEPPEWVGQGGGRSANRDRRVRDVVRLKMAEDRSHRTVTGAPAWIGVPRTVGGRFRSYLFDFGRTVVGSLHFEVRAASGGEILDTHLSETIDPVTCVPDQVYPSHSRIALGDRMIVPAGSVTHDFYHHYGFRYLTVTVREAPRGLRFRVRLRSVGYPIARKGAFRSSDRQLERIWECCAWTQQCCALDAYVDTPWREQAQWWGDARVQSWNLFHLAGDARLLGRGLRQIGAQMTPDGVTYGHAPTMAHSCILPDFTLIWLLSFWDYYWQTGSLEPFVRQQPEILRALNYFETAIRAGGGVLPEDPRYWLFLDWAQLWRAGPSTIYNLWLLHAWDRLAELYRQAEQAVPARRLTRAARSLRRRLEGLIDGDGLVRDGFDRLGRPAPTAGVHAQTMGLLTGLGSSRTRSARLAVLASALRADPTAPGAPSAYWITYVFTELAQAGQGKAVVAFIRQHWAPMANHGTTWETFAPRRAEESHSHAWSAHPLFHLMQILGGIRQAEAGWKAVTFSPILEGDRASIRLPTPLGLIEARWWKSARRANLRLHLPPGMRGTIALPGRRSVVVTGRWQGSVVLPG